MTDEELVSFTQEFRDGIMGERKDSSRMCFMICAPLQGYLNFLGIKSELVEAQLEHMNHFWIKLQDGRVLDPTADQFDEFKDTPVYLGKPHPIIHTKKLHELC